MAATPIRILLQTTIPTTADDWSIVRFSRLTHFLRDQTDEAGQTLFDVTARDRDPLGAPDPLLSTLDTSDFDQLWLFAVDTGDGLTKEDCAAISRFRRAGRLALMVTRDHMDLGSLDLQPGRGRKGAPLPHPEPRSRREPPRHRRSLFDQDPVAELPFGRQRRLSADHPRRPDPPCSGGSRLAHGRDPRPARPPRTRARCPRRPTSPRPASSPPGSAR